jgi:hypothetical protein
LGLRCCLGCLSEDGCGDEQESGEKAAGGCHR